MCHNKKDIRKDTQMARKQKKRMVLVTREMLIHKKQ